jgi:hypothetical protein
MNIESGCVPLLFTKASIVETVLVLSSLFIIPNPTNILLASCFYASHD